jgi:hypothetical protein
MLRPGGSIAFHLSNRYYELTPAVASNRPRRRLRGARAEPRARAVRVDAIAARASSWVVVGRARDVERFAARGWSEPVDGPVLTDDFSDILRLPRFP